MLFTDARHFVYCRLNAGNGVGLWASLALVVSTNQVILNNMAVDVLGNIYITGRLRSTYYTKTFGIK